MGKTSLGDFLQNRNFLALKIPSSEMSGLFIKKFVIPMNTVGLALFADGAVSLFDEGKEVSGKFDLVLAKVGDIHLRFGFVDLRSGDAFPVSATLGLVVSIATSRADLFKDFTKVLFNFPGVYSTAELKTHLTPEIRKVVSDFVAAQQAVDLHKRDRFRDVEKLVATSLERHLFGAGVRLERSVECAFSAPEFENRIAAEAKREDDARREREKIEQQKERMKQLAELFKDPSVRDLLAKAPDERVKRQLYAKLMEGGVGDDLVAAIGELLGAGADELEPETAEAIYLAAGTKVAVLDCEKGQVQREFAFRDQLRSVRCLDTGAGPTVLAGSKRTVHVIAPGRDDPQDFPLPGDRAPKGGVNAVAAHGDHLYATHSEYGVARWEAAKPGAEGEFLFADLTRKHKTTRGVQVAGGFLIFATGPTVYAVALGNGMHPIAYETSVDSPVTGLAAGGGSVYAGTEGGAIVSWRLGEPSKPEVLVRKRDPIVNLRLAKVCSIPHLFYTTKDYAVRARVIGQNLETSYESGGPTVGVLDAASNVVAATDGAGRKVLVWRSASPGRPLATVDAGRISEKPVLDLWMKKTKAQR
jgi:hypothetical protein